MAARQRGTAVEQVEGEGIYEKATGVVGNEEYSNKNVSELRGHEFEEYLTDSIGGMELLVYRGDRLRIANACKTIMQK